MGNAFHATLLLSLVLPCGVAAVERVPSQRELNGFVIGQHHDAITSSFGKPYMEETTSDGWLYLTYLVSADPLAYWGFKFPADQPDRVISVQYAGGPDSGMRPFAGVRLGSTTEAVLGVFGPPTSTESLTDPPVEVWFYEGLNYSFEFEGDGRLSSIQIFGYEGFGDPPDFPGPMPWEGVLALTGYTDPESMMAAISSDAEISRGEDYCYIDGSMWSALTDTTSLFRGELTRAFEALRTEPGLEPVEVDFRLSRDGSPCTVFLFEEGSPVMEVVLISEAGEWRIWEIVIP
ncbi:MAG: hypothetical protein R6V62_09215 [Candidatus Fermentibacteraceae bacterium]